LAEEISLFADFIEYHYEKSGPEMPPDAAPTREGEGEGTPYTHQIVHMTGGFGSTFHTPWLPMTKYFFILALNDLLFFVVALVDSKTREYRSRFKLLYIGLFHE
jgi:hypothetical protein